MRHEVRLPATFKHAYDLRPGQLRWWDGAASRMAASISIDAVPGDEVEMRLELRGTGRQVYATLTVERAGPRDRSGGRDYDLRIERMADHELAAVEAWMDEWAPARAAGDGPSAPVLPSDPRTFPRVADPATFGRPVGATRHAPRALVEGNTDARAAGPYPNVRVGSTPRGWIPKDASDLAQPGYLRLPGDPPSRPVLAGGGDPASRGVVPPRPSDPPSRAVPVGASAPRAFPPARAGDPPSRPVDPASQPVDPASRPRDPLSRPVLPRRASDPPSRGFPPSQPPPSHAVESPWRASPGPATPLPARPPAARPSLRAVTASWALGRLSVRWATPAALLVDWERHLQHHALVLKLADVATASAADEPAYGDRVLVELSLPDGGEVAVDALVAGVSGGEVVLRLAMPVDALRALDRGAAEARRSA